VARGAQSSRARQRARLGLATADRGTPRVTADLTADAAERCRQRIRGDRCGRVRARNRTGGGVRLELKPGRHHHRVIAGLDPADMD
jgi:hypothetical protein